METIKLLKLDVLGLSTTDKVKELEDMCGVHFSYDIFKDKDMLKGFEKGNASVFQFESPTANEIARLVNANERMDYNYLRRIKEECGIDIEELAKEFKEMFSKPNENQ